jgi:hypothetical protein
MANGFDDVTNALRVIEKKVDSLSVPRDRRSAAIDARFEQIDAMFDQIDARFEQVEHGFAQVDTRFDQVDAALLKRHRTPGSGTPTSKQR